MAGFRIEPAAPIGAVCYDSDSFAALKGKISRSLPLPESATKKPRPKDRGFEVSQALQALSNGNARA